MKARLTRDEMEAALPELHRKRLEELRRYGLHEHYTTQAHWRSMPGVRRSGPPFRLCDTERCFRMKLKNIRKE